MQKPEIAGVALCKPCGKTIKYKSYGRKALRLHAEDTDHTEIWCIAKSNPVRYIHLSINLEKGGVL